VPGGTTTQVAPPFADLLAGTEVVFKQAVVRTVDHHETGHETPGGTVMLEGGEQLEYDWLVLALGAQTRFGDVQGVKEHAMPFAVRANNWLLRGQGPVGRSRWGWIRHGCITTRDAASPKSLVWRPPDGSSSPCELGHTRWLSDQFSASPNLPFGNHAVGVECCTAP